jgi:hypothetical protein
MVGLWGLAILVAIALISWKSGQLDWNFPLACGFQLVLAPLGLIAALRADLVAWIVPVTRGRRLASQGLFTVAMAVLGALGTMALLREFGDAATQVPRLAALSLSGLISTFVLGAIYLLIEDDETIVGWFWLLCVGAIDVMWTYWELKQPYPLASLGILAPFALLAAGFYALVFLKSECAGAPPATGFVPAPPKFPDNPDLYVSPSSRAAPPELVWPDRPVSREAGELLGISSDLRKGRSFGRMVLRRGLGTFTWLFLIQLFFMFLSPGVTWIQYFMITANMQIVQSLKTWAYFAHTPWPRRRAFAIAIAPWLGMWLALATASLIQAPFSRATRFLAEDSYGLAYTAPPRLRFDISPELCIHWSRLQAMGISERAPGLPQEPDRMAAILSNLLKTGYGIETTPQVLLTYRPTPSETALADGRDAQQGAWLKTVEEKFRTAIQWTLIRRRLYECLLALTLTFITMLSWITQSRRGLLRSVAPMIVAFVALLGMVDPSVHRVFMRICDAVPLLTLAVFVGLCAALLIRGYRAFREWTPVNRKAPLHLKFR